MSQEETTKSPQKSALDEADQSREQLDEEFDEDVDDAQLEGISGGDGNPDDPPQKEIIIFRGST